MSLSSEPGELGPRPPLSGNHQQVLQETIKNFLCKVSRMILPHNEQLTISGTIGVTVDCGQCVLVHLSETVTKTSSGHYPQYPDSRRRIPPVLPFKEEQDGSSPSTDEMDNRISHSFALEEDISGCTRGIVIDKEVEDDDKASDEMNFKPLVIQPLDEQDSEADDRSTSPSVHRKFNRRKNGEDEAEGGGGGSHDDDTQAYTSKDYVKIPARLRCKSSSLQTDSLRSLLSNCPSRKQRKSFMIPHRHINSTDATYLSSSEEEEEEVIPPPAKRRWTANGSPPSKRKGLLLGMLLSHPSSSSAAQDLSNTPSDSTDQSDNQAVDQSALRQLLCGQPTALNLSLPHPSGGSSGPNRPSSSQEAAAVDDSQLRQLLCRPKNS